MKMSKEEIIESYLQTSDVLSFFERKKGMFGTHYVLNPNNIRKTKLISCFKKDLRCLVEFTNESVYLFCKKEDKIISSNLSKTKVLANQYVIFNFSKDKLLVYGNEGLFFGTFRKNSKEILKDSSKASFEKEENFVKESFSPEDFIKNVLEKIEEVFIYEILFNSLDIFDKKIRAQFSSEQKDFDIIELLSKENLKDFFIANLKMSSFKAISFKSSSGGQETLQFKNVGLGKIELVWKRKKESSLKKELCKIFDLYENATLIYQDNFNLSTLFREVSLDPYKRKHIYKSILEKYRDLLYLDNNHQPKLKYTQIIKSLKELLIGYTIEKVRTVRKNKLRFPREKGKDEFENFYVIKKNGIILTYLYLGESKLYEDKTNFLREFFIFMPCLILDFRSEKGEDYYLSCSNFLEGLLKKDKEYFIQLIEKNPKDIISNIESECFKDIFGTIIEEIIPNFDKYNKNLISQQKGELYEKIIFFLFSILFKINRLGGSKKHDGNIFIHDELVIGYDGKNLNENAIGSFVNSEGKFKDIGYIEKNNFKHYFFIFKKIDNNFFEQLVSKIKENLNGVYIKAISVDYIADLFNQVKEMGVPEFSRANKQKLVESWLDEEDKIIT